MEGEEENGPGEGGGGGVGPRTEQIKDCHHELVSIKLGVGSLTPITQSKTVPISSERSTSITTQVVSKKGSG